MLEAGWVVGVDIGGTFTDVVLAGPDGTRAIEKVLTTPDDPGVGVVDGIASLLARAAVPGAAISRVVHGTTLATNVVLERRGGPVALITTDGFADLLRLGRQARVEDDRYDLLYTPDPPPVDATSTFEVIERVDAHGEVLVPLTDHAVRDVVDRVVRCAPRGVAVCLLHSYANPGHERTVASACRAALPDAFVVASSDIWPEIREYERAMTAVVCALVGPVMATYLQALEGRLAAIGVGAPVEVMESSGGVMSAAAAAARPVCTVESGGAAGVLAAGLIGRDIGARDVISFDMGGTTAKTGIVTDGAPRLAHDFQVGGKGSFGATRAGTGVPVKTPVVDLAEVGAGGGSVAWLDAGGGLRVGPRSAGAVPGPACYGRGGDHPTVTDSNLVLGYLDPDGLAGGVTLSVARATAALDTVGGPLGLDAGQAALAIHEIANANMAAAIRMVTVQRGIDPRLFTLVGFGGAGPLHVARLASLFAIRTVVVPWGAGVAAAFGLIGSDPTVEVVQTRRLALDATDDATIRALFTELEARARADLGVEGDPGVVVTRAADVRYRGQAHELTVDLPDDILAVDVGSALAARFHAVYQRTSGIRSAAAAELVSARVRVVCPITAPEAVPARREPGRQAEPGIERAVRFPDADGPTRTPVVAWTSLSEGARLVGPALVTGSDTTVVIPPGCPAELDARRNLVLSPAPASPTGHTMPR